MMHKKNLFSIALMVIVSGIHGMQQAPGGMKVKTQKGVEVMIPQSVIDATPFIKAIQEATELKDFRMRALFGDQEATVIQGFVHDSEALRLGKPVENVKMYRGIETAHLSIAFAYRVDRKDLISMYVRKLQASRN